MSAPSPIPFDYTQLDPVAHLTAREAVANIKAHGKLAAQSIVAIGAELVNVKAVIGHGHYLPWIRAEFGWSERQAQRFVMVYESFGKSDNVADLGAVDVSALNLDVKKDWSLVCERGSLIDRRNGCAVFGTAECFELGSV